MISYCPWCGAILIWIAVDCRNGRYIYRHPEYGRPCQGKMDEFIVDVNWGQFTKPEGAKGKNAWKLMLNTHSESKRRSNHSGKDTHKSTRHRKKAQRSTQ